MDWLVTILVIYIILYFWNKTRMATSEFDEVKSNVDGNIYLVQKSNNAKHAADLLATIRKRLVKLKKHLINKYPNDIRTKRLIERFDDTIIVENDYNSTFTSYTQNKGEKIVFCLRTRNKNKKNSNEFHDINLMMFVAIHEMAHVISESIGHDDQEFWDNFAYLLNESVDINIWKYIDYEKYPTEYCGMTITNSVI